MFNGLKVYRAKLCQNYGGAEIAQQHELPAEQLYPDSFTRLTNKLDV